MTMKITHGLILTGTSLLLASASAHAAFADHLYMDVAAGPAFAQNPTVKSALYPGGELDLDTGLRADVVLGYKVCKSFAVELDAGLIWNSVSSISGNSLATFSASADVYQVPLMVNAVYKFPIKGRLKPYVGVGAGVAVGIFESTGIPGYYMPGGSQNFNATDTVFAYQAEVGVNYLIGKHAEVGLAYRFMGTTEYTWSANNTTLKTDGIITHAITVSFGVRF